MTATKKEAELDVELVQPTDLMRDALMVREKVKTWDMLWA